MEENPLPNGLNETIQTDDVVMQPGYSNQADYKVEVVLQLDCSKEVSLMEEINETDDTDPPKAQKYDDISEASNCNEKSGARQHVFFIPKVESCPADEEVPDPRPQPFLLSEQTPFVWMYLMDYPIDPPEYIPGFSLKLPLKYTFEFMFPNLFRRMCLPPPSIPKTFLYWTCRNPTVLQHMMEKIAFTNLGMVVESLKKKTAVRTLFWKVGLTALFGSYDASMLLRFAAYKLLKNDWESAFYLYIAAVIRISRKLDTLKNKLKYKDKDFGEVNHSLNVHVVRKHPRMKRVIIKMKPKAYCSILKTKSLVKKSFHIKNVHIREIFKTKESKITIESNGKLGAAKSERVQLFTFVSFKEEMSAEKIGNDLAYELAFSDCGDKSTDKDFEYQYLLRESDEANMKKCLFDILKAERHCGIIEEPIPYLEEDILEGEDAFSKIIHFNFPSEPSLQNQEHSENCVGSLLNPDISYLTKQVIGYILKSSIGPCIKKMPVFNIPIKCMDIETTKQVFQNVLSASVKSCFRHTSRAHPILDLKLKYFDVDLCFLIKFLTEKC